MSFESIIDEILVERNRQDGQLWGQAFDNRNTPNDWAAYIGQYAGRAIEIYRAGPSKPKYRFDAPRFRDSMVKVAALAVAAIETFDRLGGNMAKRHFDE